MPLTAIQDIIAIQDLGGTALTATAKLKERLNAYPEMRIISISIKDSGIIHGVELVAVVEGVLKSRT